MSTPSARTGGSLDAWFKISQRGSTVRQEVVAGLTTFLAMVYSVIVVPGMLGKAGFPPAAVFVATCLVAGLGSIVMGLWANLPLAIGCAISLTAFTAFSLVLGQHISVPVALGAVFLMGVLFTVISATGIRSWILRNLPHGVAHGTGIGIGLFLLLIAANGVGLVIKNPLDGLPVALGDFATFPVIMSLVGLAVIIGLEKLKVPGGILLTIIGISIVGLIFDPNVHFSGVFAMPSLSDENGNSLIGSLDIMGALNPVVLPSVLALVMTAVFDATGTIRAVAGQANLLDKDGQIIDGGKALTTDSMSSVFSGLVGAAPAAVYIESAAGTAAGVILFSLFVGVVMLTIMLQHIEVADHSQQLKEERIARAATAEVAIVAIQKMEERLAADTEENIDNQLLTEVSSRVIGNLRRRADGRNDVESSVQEENLERRFRLAALRSERAELYHLRATREISNETLQKLLHDLDLLEALLIEENQ